MNLLSEEELKERVVSLEKTYSDLCQECSFMRCILISDPDAIPFSRVGTSTFLESYLDSCNIAESGNTSNNGEEDTHQVEEQRNRLLHETGRLKEENDDLYDALEAVVKEKNDLLSKKEALEEEIETCRQVINFLVIERDKMKKEIELKDDRLAEYRASFSNNRELILRAQNPLKVVVLKK